MCKKTEREADGGRGEFARRQRERRMEGGEVCKKTEGEEDGGRGSVQEDRGGGGWRER